MKEDFIHVLSIIGVGSFQVLSRACDFGASAGLLKMSDEVKERWEGLYKELTKAQDGLYGALTARAAPQVLRMACIYALMGTSKTVEISHLEAAHAVWKYADASVAYIFGDRLGDPTADAILAALNGKLDAGMTRSEIYDLFSRKKSKEQIDAALQTLEARGLVHAVQEETRGRPTQRWYAA